MCKKKSEEENKCITEMLLDGLTSPFTSPTKSMPTLDPLSEECVPPPDSPVNPPEPELSFFVSQRPHSTPDLRDISNSGSKVHLFTVINIIK